MGRSTKSKCFWSMLALAALLLNLNLLNLLLYIQDSPNCPIQEATVLLVDSRITNIEIDGKQTSVKQSHFKEERLQLQDFIPLSKNSTRCVDSRRPLEADIKIEESVWQLHSHVTGNVYIYSAFYDDRPAAGFLPTVRIIAFSGFRIEIRSIFCHVWYESIAEPYVVAAIINETGMNIYNFDKMAYKEFTYTCPLTISRPIPTHVSITTKPKCASSYSTLVPINFVPKQSPQFEFGVCVTNGYGSPPVDEFVEWMELLLLYGVSEVNLYDTHYENTTRMFSYYAERNVLSVRKLPHPLLWDAQWYRKVRNLRSVAFNDCMLRNMYRYRYLVVIDLDEMIVPRYHVNYSAVLDQVDARLKLTKRYHSYTFFNVFFLLDFPEDKTQTLRTMRYRNRVKHSQPYYASKSFIDPLSCFNLFNHYCYTPLPGYARHNKTVFVPAVIGASHHYRTCGKFYGLLCETLYKEKIQDDVMFRVKTRLLERVEPVLKLLNHDT